MPIALVAVAAVSLGLSVYQTVDAKKKQKEAEKAAEEYERQNLTNPYENLQVSTRGSDMQQENVNTQVSTAVDSLRSGGSRAILGGIPTLYDNVIKSNQQIAAGLDQQEIQNQQMEAQGNIIVQNMNEQRERDDLLGIGNAINTARQDYNIGLTNTVQSGFAVASSAGELNSSIKSGTGWTGGANNKTSANTKSSFGGFNFNPQANTLSPSSNQPKNAIQANLYQNQIDEYNTYNRFLYGNRRGF